MERHLKEKFKADLQVALRNLVETVQDPFTHEDVPKSDAALQDVIDKASLERDRDIWRLIQNRYRRLAWEISTALQRLEEGDFGICEVCGDPIAVKRLEAQPTTTTCIECQRRLEMMSRAAIAIGSEGLPDSWVD